MVVLGKHIRCTARVINNAVRLEQSGYHHNAPGPGVDYTLQIVEVDSADAENRQTYLRVNPPDMRKPDRRIVRFCGRGEDRAKGDIVCAFALRSGNATVVAVAPRLFARLMQPDDQAPLGEKIWGEARRAAPVSS